MSEDVQDVMVEASPVEKPSFDGIFDEDKIIGGGEAWTSTTGTGNGLSSGKLVLSKEVQFPPEVAYQKMFVTGASGSGKSYTVGVLSEEFARLGLQFVMFDSLGAHGGLKQLDNVVEVTPDMEKSVNVERLVDEVVSNPNMSVVVNLSHVDDAIAQEIVAEYCDELFKRRLGRALTTIFEECQDLVPQGKSAVRSHGPIIKLCKKGRQYGYGVILISQRPHEVAKAALTQCTTYIIHNVIQTRDLIAVQDQISQGVDKKPTRVLIDKIRAFDAGECLVYSPDNVPKMIGQANIHHVLTKIRSNRSTEHSGDNVVIELQGGKVWHPAKMNESKTIGGMKADMGIDSMLNDAKPDMVVNTEVEAFPSEDFSPIGMDDDIGFEDWKPLQNYEYDVGDEDWVADLDLDEKLEANPALKSKITGYGFIVLLASGMYLLLKPQAK
tara:strand:- start:945 stop:2261 length:1317 start_codon:yes stop_codon:yes gene_type:complete